jgi:hypothetical protein
LDSELTQIKNSHTSLINDRAGAEGNMIDLLQERHIRALADLSTKSQKDHSHFVETLQNKRQNDLSTRALQHKTCVQELQAKIKGLHASHKAAIASIQANAEAQTEALKKDHKAEVNKRTDKHSAELSTLETSTKVKYCLQAKSILCHFHDDFDSLGVLTLLH